MLTESQLKSYAAKFFTKDSNDNFIMSLGDAHQEVRDLMEAPIQSVKGSVRVMRVYTTVWPLYSAIHRKKHSYNELLEISNGVLLELSKSVKYGVIYRNYFENVKSIRDLILKGYLIAAEKSLQEMIDLLALEVRRYDLDRSERQQLYEVANDALKKRIQIMLRNKDAAKDANEEYVAPGEKIKSAEKPALKPGEKPPIKLPGAKLLPKLPGLPKPPSLPQLSNPITDMQKTIHKLRTELDNLKKKLPPTK